MKQPKWLARIGTSVVGVFAPLAVLPATNPFQKAQSDIGAIQTATGLGKTDLPTLVGSIINAVLGLLGIILLIYLLYGGFLWMTSGGDTEGVKKATTMIKNAVVGLIIVMAAVAIANFVINALTVVAT